MALTRWSYVLVAIGICTLSGVVLVRTTLGHMAFYVHPLYDLLLYLCGIVLFFMAVVSVLQRHQLPAFAFAFLLIPIMLGLAVPPRPLDANAISTRMTTLNRVAQRPARDARVLQTNQDTTQWTLYDWAVAMSIDTAPLVNKAVVVEGFVVRPQDGPQTADQFMLARYVLTCCTADAGGVGMPVTWGDAARLTNDQWVRVSGVIAREQNGQIYIVAQHITPIDIPRKPYLLP